MRATLIWLVGVLIAAVAIARVFLVDIGVVGHNGMAPTLIAGDYILVWRHWKPVHTDIVMCPHPRVQGVQAVARVLGMPGEQLRLQRGALYVDNAHIDQDLGQAIAFNDSVTGRTEQPRLAHETFGGHSYTVFLDDKRPLFLAETQIGTGLFLLGDNRGAHLEDSRSFGEVVADSCRGKVFMRLAPSDSTPASLDHGWFDILQ